MKLFTFFLSSQDTKFIVRCTIYSVHIPECYIMNNNSQSSLDSNYHYNTVSLTNEIVPKGGSLTAIHKSVIVINECWIYSSDNVSSNIEKRDHHLCIKLVYRQVVSFIINIVQRIEYQHFNFQIAHCSKNNKRPRHHSDLI